MKKNRYDWFLQKAFPGGHRFFLDKKSGRYAVCTARYPNEDSDGVLWLDQGRPVVQSENNPSRWVIPLIDKDGTLVGTPAETKEAHWLIAERGMQMQIGPMVFTPGQNLPIIPAKSATGDVSTAYITQSDGKFLQHGGVPGQIGTYEYGHVVLTNACEKPEALRSHGMSEAYINLLCVAHRQKIHYLFLDQDGYDVDGLPRFEW